MPFSVKFVNKSHKSAANQIARITSDFKMSVKNIKKGLRVSGQKMLLPKAGFSS